MDKYHAESTIRNRNPILEILKKEIEGSKKLLEIGSGTGQHAAYFSKKCHKFYGKQVIAQ